MYSEVFTDLENRVPSGLQAAITKGRNANSRAKRWNIHRDGNLYAGLTPNGFLVVHLCSV